MSATTTTVKQVHTTHGVLPAFPSNVATAPIATISLNKLVANDEEESGRVLDACRTHGFFYLDLRDEQSGNDLLDLSERMLALAREVYKLPLAEKQKYTMDQEKSLMGYKPIGTIKQSDKAKRPDTTEFMNVSKDHMFDITESRTYPPQVEAAKDDIRNFQKGAHATGMLVLTMLAKKLGVAPDAFTQHNDFFKAAEDHLRMTLKHPHDEKSNKIGLVSHTDFGSITLLWNWLGGLQIQSRDPAKKGEWEFVQPVPGHVIINLGDAIVKFSNGILKSAKHRVVNAPGEQGQVDRYSVVYFVRPNNETPMKAVDGIDSTGLEKVDVSQLFPDEEQGKVYTALEWQQKRTVHLQGQGLPAGD